MINLLMTDSKFILRQWFKITKHTSHLHTHTHLTPYYYDKICQYKSEMNSNDLNTQNNYCYGCVLRKSPHRVHIELNNGIVDVTIPLTKELSDSIILVLKLDGNFRNKSLKDGIFKFTNNS